MSSLETEIATIVNDTLSRFEGVTYVVSRADINDLSPPGAPTNMKNLVQTW